MHSTGEGLAFSEHSETVAEVCHVVLGLQFVSVERFVTLCHHKQKLVQTLYIRAYLLLTDRGTEGSDFATEKAVVLVSTTSSILWKIVGLEREVPEKVAA